MATTFKNRWQTTNGIDNLDLSNLDECVQKKFLNVKTGKLHVKDHMIKWGGLGRNFLRIFVVAVVVVLFYVRFWALNLLIFYRNSRSGVFWKNVFLKIFKINSTKIKV